MRTKVFFLNFSLILFIFSCEYEEEFSIENIICDKTTIYNSEPVKFECIATAPFSLNYHWALISGGGTSYQMYFTENEREDEFNQGRWVKIELPKLYLFDITSISYNPKETFTMEVLVYSNEADSPYKYEGENYVVYEYVNSKEYKHYFSYDKKGELWDIYSKDFTVFLNEN